MSAPGTWSRRSLLLAGAGLVAAGCTPSPSGASNARRPAPGGTAASTGTPARSTSPTAATPAGVTPSARFDLAARPRAALREIRLHEADRSLQGFAYDVRNHRMFAVQRREGADLCISQLGPAGELVAHLHVDDAGHGQSFGVEPVGDASYLWFEWDATEDTDWGRGTAVVRFPFVPGRRPRPQRVISGRTEIGCATDPVNRTVLFRRYDGHRTTYRLYRQRDASAGRLGRALAAIEEPPNEALHPNGGPPILQAFAVLGRYAYTWLGTGGHSGSAADPFDSYLSAIDLRTGRVVQQELITAGRSLPFREPEGLAIDVVDGTPRLCFGFASRPHPDSAQRLASVYYIDTLR